MIPGCGAAAPLVPGARRAHYRTGPSLWDGPGVGGGHEVTVPPLGGGGIAPQNCTIASQCKSASARLAPCKNFLWCLWRLVFWALWAKRPFPPTGGGGGWHKALVVGSVSLWRRLLASRL